MLLVRAFNCSYRMTNEEKFQGMNHSKNLLASTSNRLCSNRKVALNFESGDEIVPVFVGLQHLYLQIVLRNEVLKFIDADVNEATLCENHRNLRGILGVGDWDQTSFNWYRLRNALSA